MELNITQQALNRTEQKLYDLLPNETDFINRDDLSKKLNISKNTVNKYISKLREKGRITTKLVPVSGGDVNDPKIMTQVTKLTK